MTERILSNAGRWLLNRRAFLRFGGTGLSGIALASILAECLAGKPRPHFVSSPLPRARKSIELILEALGLPPVYDTDPRLMEIDLGAWSGLTDLDARNKEKYLDVLRGLLQRFVEPADQNL